jgi:hypothetical protein
MRLPVDILTAPKARSVFIKSITPPISVEAARRKNKAGWLTL